MGLFTSLFGKKDELRAAAGTPSQETARSEADQIKAEVEKYEGELDDARQQVAAHPQLAEHFHAIVRAKEQQVAAAQARLARVEHP